MKRWFTCSAVCGQSRLAIKASWVTLLANIERIKEVGSYAGTRV